MPDILMPNQIVITEPPKDATTPINHASIDIEAKCVNVGSVSVPATEALLTELKKCLDAEIPKLQGYKSHTLTIAAAKMVEP